MIGSLYTAVERLEVSHLKRTVLGESLVVGRVQGAVFVRQVVGVVVVVLVVIRPDDPRADHDLRHLGFSFIYYPGRKILMFIRNWIISILNIFNGMVNNIFRKKGQKWMKIKIPKG